MEKGDSVIHIDSAHSQLKFALVMLKATKNSPYFAAQEETSAPQHSEGPMVYGRLSTTTPFTVLCSS